MICRGGEVHLYSQVICVLRLLCREKARSMIATRLGMRVIRPMLCREARDEMALICRMFLLNKLTHDL